MPPFFVFPRKRMRAELLDGAPSDSVGFVTDSGFINQDGFLDYIKHFAHHTRRSLASPVLLLLDNHSSHISLAVIDYCRTIGIHLLSIPPHSSHKLQPLDVAFYGPLKTSYAAQWDM